jgi:hypothetical protein
MYVRAAVKGSKDLRCTITPKVHLMLEHVEWQMTNIRGGGRRQNGRLGGAAAPRWEAKALCFRTVQNPIARAHAREKAHSRNMHPDVIYQVLALPTTIFT